MLHRSARYLASDLGFKSRRENRLFLLSEVCVSDNPSGLLPELFLL